MTMLAGTWNFDAAPTDPVAIWRDDAAGIALAACDGGMAQSQDGRWVVALDGAVYNRADLLRRLDVPTPSSNVNACALAEAVARWGIDRALLAMDGKAALALWDRQDRVLHLARDRLGEAALYWVESKNGIAFGSQARALAARTGLGEIDRSALASVLRHGMAPAPQTMFAQMRKLPAGWVLTVKGGQAVSRPYWSAADRAGAVAGSFGGGLTAAAERLNLLLRSSVALCLDSGDGAPGVLLDGGMASALVTAMARDLAGEGMPAIARSDHLDVATIPGLVGGGDQPMADAQAMVPLLLADGAHRAGIAMVLGADGAASLLGSGSAHGAQARRWEALSHIPEWRRRLSRLMPNADPTLAARSPAEMARLSRALWRGLPDPVPDCGRLAPWPDLPAPAHPIMDLMLADTLAHLPEAECRWSEQAGRAGGLDVRRPLITPAVAEFVWSLPEAFSAEGATMLEILAARYLPPGERVAIAPPVPLATWLSGPLAEWAGDLLSEARLKRCGLMSSAAVAAARRHGKWPELWAALMVEAWADSL